jgi:hypothetical protein
LKRLMTSLKLDLWIKTIHSFMLRKKFRLIFWEINWKVKSIKIQIWWTIILSSKFISWPTKIRNNKITSSNFDIQNRQRKRKKWNSYKNKGVRELYNYIIYELLNIFNNNQ